MGSASHASQSPLSPSPSPKLGSLLLLCYGVWHLCNDHRCVAAHRQPVINGGVRVKYGGNNPKRRIATIGFFTARELGELASTVRYQGSPHHKLHPADYDFEPPVAPRPSKSVCDDKRVIQRDEAQRLLLAGIRLGMVSSHFVEDRPKYVWAVDDFGEVYEAKLGHDQLRYHGYRLAEDDEAMREWAIAEWSKRTKGQ